MAKTAVVNKRGRRRRRRNPAATTNRRRRRRNYGAAAAINPRRRSRRRRGHGAARRRRNPVSPYASSSYYRRPNPRRTNPSFDVMSDVTEILPAATGGIWLSRFALKQAGPYEADSKGVLEPGIKHALAIYLAATLGSSLIGSVLGSGKESIAKIAALGFGGDLFLRTRFMKDSEFVKNNLSLQGMGYDDAEVVEGYYVPDGVSGFQATSPIGAGSMVDAFGNTFVSTPQGWQLQGADDLYMAQDGTVYQLSGGGNARLGGFARTSPIGGARSGSKSSSFGYA